MDQRLRDDERAAALGDPDAETRLIRARLRLGLLDEAQVAVAAWLDHEPARRVVPALAPPRTPWELIQGHRADPLGLVRAARGALGVLAWRWEPSAFARACVAAIDERIAGGDSAGPREVLHRFNLFPCGWDQPVDDAAWAVVHILCAAGDDDPRDALDCLELGIDHAVAAFHPQPILAAMRQALIARALTV